MTTASGGRVILLLEPGTNCWACPQPSKASSKHFTWLCTSFLRFRPLSLDRPKIGETKA